MARERETAIFIIRGHLNTVVRRRERDETISEMKREKEKERERMKEGREREDHRLRRRGRDEKERRGGRRKISSPHRTYPATEQRCRGNERGNASVQRGRRKAGGGKKPVTGEVNTRR